MLAYTAPNTYIFSFNAPNSGNRVNTGDSKSLTKKFLHSSMGRANVAARFSAGALGVTPAYAWAVET